MPQGSDAFQCVASVLESATSLTGPQVRGAIRLALKAAGLEAALVSHEEMKPVLERIMPEKLRAQGLSQTEAEATVSAALAAIDAKLGSGERKGPGSVFDRLDQARKGDT